MQTEDILSEMERLEKLAGNLREQRYSKLEGDHPLQRDYENAIKETLAAYNRLAQTIGGE